MVKYLLSHMLLRPGAACGFFLHSDITINITIFFRITINITIWPKFLIKMPFWELEGFEPYPRFARMGV